MNRFRQSVRTLLKQAPGIAAGLALVLCAASCRHEHILPEVEPIAHTDAYDIWPDSIDLHQGVILRVVSDSLMLVRVNGNTLDSIRACPSPADSLPLFRSDFPLLDFLFRLERSTSPSGRYTPHTPLEIYLNPLLNDSARTALQSRLRNNLVIPASTRRLDWPQVNANAEWLLAASELSAALGDQSWQRTVESVARNVADADRRMSRNNSSGLFCGLPGYMAANPGMFPAWMEQADLAAVSTCFVNVAYAAAMSRIPDNPPLPADSLVRALKHELWIPNMGYFSAMAYGVPSCQIPLQVTDNMAQAIAILAGILPEAMQKAMVAKTPVTDMGVAIWQPSLPPASGPLRKGIDDLALQAAWTAACARVGNEAAYRHALGALLALEGKRLEGYRYQTPAFRSTFTTLLFRAFLGVRLAADGFFLAPYIPESLPGDKHLLGWRYRDAVFDIHIVGTGQAIASMTLDGAPCEPFFPTTLKGRHEIRITLAGASADPGHVSIQDEVTMVPLPPLADWDQSRQALLSPGTLPAGLPDSLATARRLSSGPYASDFSWLVWLNATLEEEVFDRNYSLYRADRPVVVQFTGFAASRLSGFSSKPYLYVPREQRYTLYASELARSGTKIIENKEIAAKFVESNRFKNRNIAFDFDAPAEGRYQVEVHYASGLGIINSQRGLTLRRLYADGNPAGVFFFPQRKSSATATADARESWQEMTSWTNPLDVTLHAGTNYLEIRYFQPSPVYVDPRSNAILVDMIRILPLPSRGVPMP